MIHIFSIISYLFIALGLAYPLERNVAADIQVLSFANVLEQLESAFYTQTLDRFNVSSFAAAGFASPQIPIQQIQSIAGDERTHAIALQSVINALGGQVVSNCTFNFSSALVDVNTMVSTARVVENVGVSAYLGALSLFTDHTLVTAAGSILSIEARHQTILNLLSNATSIPQPFDIALTPAEVLAIAGTFISGCKLGFSANPSLTITNTDPLQGGMKLNFSSPALNGSNSQLSCKVVTGRSNQTLYQPVNSCMVPGNVTGPMYVFITRNEMGMKSSAKMNGTMNSSMVIAGPALLFVNQPDSLGNLINPGAATGNPNVSTPSVPTATTAAPNGTISVSELTSTSTTLTTGIPSPGTYTTTLSPAQASALLSGLSG